LLLLITGNRRTFSSSICRTALARSSSSRQQWMPRVITSRCSAAGIEAVLRQPFADDVAVSHHADKSVILPDRNGANIMLPHQFREVGDRGIRIDPVDALVHYFSDFHGWTSVSGVDCAL